MKKSISQKLIEAAKVVMVLENMGIDVSGLNFSKITKGKTGRLMGSANESKSVKGTAKKGYKYKPGTHWTQKAANKAKVKRVLRNAHLAMVEINKAKKEA